MASILEIVMMVLEISCTWILGLVGGKSVGLKRTRILYVCGSTMWRRNAVTTRGCPMLLLPEIGLSPHCPLAHTTYHCILQALSLDLS